MVPLCFFLFLCSFESSISSMASVTASDDPPLAWASPVWPGSGLTSASSTGVREALCWVAGQATRAGSEAGAGGIAGRVEVSLAASATSGSPSLTGSVWGRGRFSRLGRLLAGTRRGLSGGGLQRGGLSILRDIREGLSKVCAARCQVTHTTLSLCPSILQAGHLVGLVQSLI